MLPMCRAATGEDTGSAQQGISAPTYKASQAARSEALEKLTNTARMGDEAGKGDNTAPGFVPSQRKARRSLRGPSQHLATLPARASPKP
ncbi:hypothetical protein ERJ75_000568900 [Trypanosoma vivax]|nr:hypothetical protein ERJ75_000568900 [Trypanosoma vivax]